MKKEDFKNIIFFILMIVLIVLAVKFFIFLLPFILVLALAYFAYDIYRRVKLMNISGNNVNKTYKKRNNNVQEAHVVKEKNEE